MDVLPRGHPLNVAGYERLAREKLAPPVWDGIDEGAGDERTRSDNEAAFERWSLRPRFLVDLTGATTATTVLGTPVSMPLLVAPTGWQRLVHPEGEVATARASAEAGTVMCVASFTTSSLPEIAAVAPAAARWFQLYWPSDRELAASLLARAEAAGYTAVVVTLDTWLLAWRPRDLERAYLPFLKGEGLANYFSDPVFRAALDQAPEDDLQAAVGHWISVYSDPMTWEDLAFLRETTNLPIVLKGILHPDDARLAVDHGMDGVLVSNHGGRQVDGAIAALDALPTVVDAVPEDFPVLFDSGVRSGADAMKAIALGARAVLLGRPYLWGLGIAGEDGVRQVLRGFLAELDLTLALSGHTSFGEVGREDLASGPDPARTD